MATAGARKRAFFMAEQLGFDQIRRDRATIDRNERTARAAAPLMNRACDELFAPARFAGHEHRRFGWRDLVDHSIDVLHRRRAAIKSPEATQCGRRRSARRGEKGQRDDIGDVDRGIVQIHVVLRFLSCR